ncbi:MAG: daunorubicin resistance protein DrrA family ABC transporter ATP-binding protein [Acidimicrobiia bacterium]|nr:MAG: daunorubicin resistance protein DrrA family ABC transporter ATP-binding protein [Acidimicrobiia bacterium]
MSLIEVTDLVKVFDKDIRAVDGITFHVDEGEVFGFLGPNGAGKTTTIRVLVTLSQATSGTAMVDGLDVAKDPHQVRTRIGYAAQFIGVDGDLTGRENLVLQGRLHGMSAEAAENEADHLLEVIDLIEAADRRAGTFSGGMRRRLDLAQALVHRPQLLFLDEPTTGLDPQNRHALWAYLRRLNDDGVTIFLTTQYLEEADALTDRIAIIDNGKIVVDGTPDELKAGIGGDTITVAVDDTERAAATLEALDDIHEVQAVDHSVTIYVADGASRVVEVVHALDAAGISPHQLELSEPTLDQVFLKHTGEQLRVEEVAAPSRMVMGRRTR